MNKKFLLLIFFLSFIFFVPKIVYGAEQIDQQQPSSSAIVGGSDIYSQTFTPGENNFSHWYMGGFCSSGNYDAIILSWSFYDYSDNLLASGIINDNCNSNNNIYFTLQPDNPIQVYPNYVYKIQFNNSGAGTLGFIYGDSYAGGQASGGSVPADKDFFFTEYYEDTFITFDDVIFPNKPANGETVFENNNYVDFFGTYQNYYADVLVLDIYPTIGLPIERSITLYQSISAPTAYNFSVPLLAGDYQYKLELKTGGINGSIATTTYDRGLISFTFDALHIATATPAFFAMPFGVSEADICQGISTSTGITDLHIFGDIECGLKRAFFWAVYPNQSSLNRLDTSYNNIKASFPFNAFFALTGAVNEAIGTSTPNMEGTFSIPFISATGTYIMLPIVSSSSMPDLIGSSNTTLFRNTITWILWIIVAVLIFLTFKSI